MFLPQKIASNAKSSYNGEFEGSKEISGAFLKVPTVDIYWSQIVFYNFYYF